MKNPLTWLDQQCLELAEKAAKKINWLTGWDNFQIARQTIFLFAFLWVLFGLMYEKNPLAGVIVSSLFPLITGPFLWGAANLAEEWRGEAMMRGSLNYLQEVCLFLARFAAHVLFWALFLPDCVADVLRNKHYTQGACAALAMLCPIAVCYFISIFQPPFKRSQAWQFLKRKLESFAQKLLQQPRPQPVPVRVW